MESGSFTILDRDGRVVSISYTGELNPWSSYDYEGLTEILADILHYILVLFDFLGLWKPRSLTAVFSGSGSSIVLRWEHV